MDDPQVGLMAAPQLHWNQPTEASSASGSNVWGTWEELLLASAVRRHGTNKWNLVSAELQARARAYNVPPPYFTPEACRSKYYAIKGRYSGEEDREGDLGNDMPWFEELRKLRVAHLKRELEHYDGSIGSLQIKLKRLKAEREKSVQSSSKQLGKAAIVPVADACGNIKADRARSGVREVSASQSCCHRSDDFSLEARAPREVSRASGDVVPRSRARDDEERPQAVDAHEERRVEKLGTAHETLGKCREAEPVTADDRKNVEMVAFDEELSDATGDFGRTGLRQGADVQDTQLDRGIDDSTQLEDVPVARPQAFLREGEEKPVGSLPVKPEDSRDVGSVDGSKSAETLAGSHDADVCLDSHESRDADVGVREDDPLNGDGIPQAENGVGAVEADEPGRENAVPLIGERAPFNGVKDDDDAKPVGVAVTVARSDVSDGQGGGGEHVEDEIGVSKSHEDDNSVNACDSMKVAKEHSSIGATETLGPLDTTVDRQHSSEDVSTPRRKKRFLLLEPEDSDERRQDGDATRVLQEAGGGKETRGDDDDKHTVIRESPQKMDSECKQSLPVESADSTEEEHHPAASETKGSRPAPLVDEERAETLELEPSSKAANKEITGGLQSLASRELATTSSEPLRFEEKKPSGSSTENSELREVWGESAEVVNNEREAGNKKERMAGRGRKRKLKKSITKDLASACKEESEATGSIKAVETSVRMESMATSREGSGSLHDQEGKEGDDYDTEAWQRMERYSGDSRFEKSEVGSPMDGNEDISPMSRRNRREPKVPGKLLPLLECLRTICAHKCAPLFKHNQESQDNPRYDRLIRAHIDLGMIRARLEEGSYSGSLHFFRDLLLMVNNALVYYPRDAQEFVAATGLRECIMREMANVLETEALLKQEGPSFRKREPKNSFHAAKAGQPPAGRQGKKKGLTRRASTNETAARDMVMKANTQSKGVGSIVVGHDIAGTQVTTVEGVKEVVKPEKGTTDTKSTADTKKKPQKSAFNENPRGQNVSNGLKMGHPNSSAKGQLKGLRDPDSNRVNNVSLEEEGKLRDEQTDSSEAWKKSKGSLAKVVDNSKTSAIVSDKHLQKEVENMLPKTPAVVPRPDTPQEPVKRGVGRPPKHSQQASSQKAKESEAPAQPKKRVRR